MDKGVHSTIISAAVQAAVNGRPMSGIYSERNAIADEIQITLGLSGDNRQAVLDAIRSKAKCYAGLLGTMRARHAGYADTFEVPKPYPGRTAIAAGWGVPTADEITDKPWLTGLPRLIFISDKNGFRECLGGWQKSLGQQLAFNPGVPSIDNVQNPACRGIKSILIVMVFIRQNDALATFWQPNVRNVGAGEMQP